MNREIKERTKWFMDARFGMFIHWGLYSIPACGEWVMSQKEMTIEEYRKYFEQFDPVDYDPKTWVRLAKEAGMKYVVLTAKHHDGFCLFDSKLTDYKATNTKAGRDLVREFVDACREEGLKVGLYFSIIDWHHPDFPKYGDRQHPMRNNVAYKDEKIDFDRYLDYMHGQVKELVTNYGKLDLLWFDFSYDDMTGEKWKATDLIKMVRHYQPDVIIDNRLEGAGDNHGSIATAHAHGVPLIIDNTFPTPVNCRPFEWGADIVTHSTTKYMDGHGAAVGGAIVDSGKFDWMAHADKYPGLCTPDESYHGVTYAEKFGNEGAFITKCTTQLMRDLGCIQSPQNAFLLNLGLESLHVRMPKHVENGQAVAEFLEKHPKVAYVNYPGLPSSKYYERARKYLPHGGCGVVSFGLKGGREAASAFMQNLKLGAIETHVADARTCCLNPATSTHRQMTDEQLKEAGVPAELIRISLGLEDKEDLIADISNALDAIRD